MQRALAIRQDSRYLNTTAGKLAYQLGWCSIALGAIELMASRQVARALGMRGKESLIRAYGVRELVKGVGILTSPNPTPWLWGRVAGDALDFGTLAFAYRSSPNRRNVALAMANVAATAAVDVLAARQLSAIARRQEQPFVDYSNRSGFPRGLEMSRGLASDFVIPPDFRTPEALRPWTSEG
ncbi:MAG TPA: hypothetical protein VFZ38_19620 [Vicinamibacterales bacterium]